MRLAHVLVCHTTDPSRAIESIPHAPGDALWYVFLHSDNIDIEKTARRLMHERGGNIFPYKTNRGLAKSWNDAIHLAVEAKSDAIILLNDDLVFREGMYAEFVQTIYAVRALSTNVAYVTPLGLETGASLIAGQVIPQQFACCALSPECIERIGYFDENFQPAYYEDVDYDRRARLAGMTVHVHQQVLVDHERSSTKRLMSPADRVQADKDFEKNRLYFERKWGQNAEHQHPFADTGMDIYISFENRDDPYNSFNT